MAVNTVYLGIGSNLNKEQAILFAIKHLSSLFTNFKHSSVYDSRPIRQAEPDYLNIVVKGNTEDPIEVIAKKIKEIELMAGKELMYANATNFGFKRRLDIDVLLFGNAVLSEPCKVPRHDIADYPFVLCPLAELDPELEHPLLRVKVGKMWEEMQPRLTESMRVQKVDFDFSKSAPDWNELEEDNK